MKKIIMLLVVAVLAIGVPVLGQAVEDTNNCNAATPQPAHPAGSPSVPVVGTTVWAKQIGSGGEIGVKGNSGWLLISGDPTTQKGRIDGHQVNSGFSGYVIVNGANSKLCVSAPPNLAKTKPLG